MLIAYAAWDEEDQGFEMTVQDGTAVLSAAFTTLSEDHTLEGWGYLRTSSWTQVEGDNDTMKATVVKL